MEYEKIVNLLNDRSNNPSKFRTRAWVEINDEARGTYSHNKQIEFKMSMLRSSLCDYTEPYILVKGNITVNAADAADTAADGAAAKSTDEKSNI